MFCKNCGKELVGTPEICMGCGAKPLAGNSFCPTCGAETNPLAEICMKCGVRIAKGAVVTGDISPKSRITTTLLAWFLGIFGAHRFYLGKTGTAVGMLVLGISYLLFYIIGMMFLAAPFNVIGILCIVAVGIWAFIDFIFAVSGNMKDKEGKLIKNW